MSNKSTGTALKITFILAILITLTSWRMKTRLPGPTEILPDLENEPAQTETYTEPFQVTKKGITYTITPKYDYQITGLIVTYHESGSFIDITHKDWGDEINIKDLCILWGQNTAGGLYNKLQFSSGNFTCSWRTSDRDTWQNFNNSQISNNHLITADPAVAKQIMKANTGDQIQIKGHLAEYSHPGGFKRGTSTTRTDTGNGACETIYVTEFNILKSNNRGWPQTMTASALAAIAIAIISIARLFTTTHP